jgi:membrane associated rhomboid family serine protease
MLIPLRHSQMTARRWPVITFALIALNAIIFLLTNSTIESQAEELSKTKFHLLLLAAAHPEVAIPEGAKEFVEKFKQDKPSLWKELQSPDRRIEDEYDARIRAFDFMTDIQAEMNTIAASYIKLRDESLTENYAFIPSQRKPITYLTSMFLHGGWLHLIGNMWFLWLAGFVLEDAWGRPVYAALYLIFGIAATQFYAWTNTGSIVPTLGASGAVAGLMGAFLVRFPKLQIEMAWVLWLGLRPRMYRFSMAAYWLLPLWLGSEVLSGTLFGISGGVAHWAHVGGFAGGALIALALKASGVEHKLNEAVEQQVSLKAEPEIAEATELLDANDFDGAIAKLVPYFEAHLDSIDACMLLEQAYYRKGSLPEYYDMAVKSIELYLKSNSSEAALNAFDDFVRANGDREMLSPATWIALARAAEASDRFDQALNEYKLLIEAYPEDRQSLQAQLAAAKVYMKRLNDPRAALKLLEAASASKVPHLDWQPAIDAAIREANSAAGPSLATVAAVGR